MNKKEKFRLLPSVDKLLMNGEIQKLLQEYSREDVVDGMRAALEAERERIIDDIDPGTSQEVIIRIILMTRNFVEKENRASLTRVINATGVIVHTNLGRAILSEKAIEMAVEAARHHSNLEFNLEKGSRGNRMVHLKRHLIELTGAEDAMAVNNNAAAVLLMLDTFAKDREVVVSRGELIEIGGSFRLPDILKKSGAKLVEVGCTNKTYPSDYENAITENTAILMKSHKSNYIIRGFSYETSGKDLAAIGKKYGVISAEDMGSGLMMDLSQYGLKGEVTARELIEEGLDLVTFSGDKMLGGPQCGLIVGKKDLIEKMEKNPLTRALRLDKMTIAAMEGTFLLYRNREKLESQLPFLKMLSRSPDSIFQRTKRFIAAIKEKAGKNINLEIIEGTSRIGGGAFPDTDIPTFLLRIIPLKASVDEMYQKLLSGNPPIIGRIYQDSLVLDLRTVLIDEEEELLKGLLDLIGKIL